MGLLFITPQELILKGYDVWLQVGLQAQPEAVCGEGVCAEAHPPEACACGRRQEGRGASWFGNV